MSNYTKWESFKFKGRRFLALYNSDGVHIKGERFENYGSYFDIADFKRYYRRLGPENLILKEVTK